MGEVSGSSTHNNYRLGYDMLTVVRANRRKGGLSVVLVGLTLFIFWSSRTAHRLSLPLLQAPFEHPSKPYHPPCRNLPGANDTVVILRTGSTELEDRLTAHLSTSLRCFPNYLIFSDLEEQYRVEQIIDALSSVDIDIRKIHPDFEIYRRLQHYGRAVLDLSELSGPPEAFERNEGIEQNPGWKLDKWKFMPTINRTFYEYPDAKCTQPYYAGCGTCLGKDLFGHGGSGFVVSQPAMRLATQYYSAHKAEVEALTDRNWAGDYVLGKVFGEAGVSFTDAWPHFQGDYPGLVAYAGPDGRYAPAASTREWCMPTISYHHMSANMVKGLWNFEQRWISARTNGSDTLTHGDVFKEYVLPQMMAPKADWDNLSDEDGDEASDVEGCRAKCEAQSTCRQYSFVSETKRCRIRMDPRLGKQSNGTKSGWMEDRVQNFAHNAPACGDEGWQVGARSRRTSCG